MSSVLLEAGSKKVFASSLDWPGWSRAGRDPDAALAALFAYGSRYAAVLKGRVPGFKQPRTIGDFDIVERDRGDAGTDFGVPSVVAAADRTPVDEQTLRRLTRVLEACWATFDAMAESAEGVQLRKGPRGGGRELEKIRQHVLEADRAYIGSIGGAMPKTGGERAVRDALLAAVRDRAHGLLPERGPRGGERWPARYGARRTAWHVLDHAWEIEDRMQ